MCMTIFHLVANKELTWSCNSYSQDKPICMRYLSVWQTLQHVQGLLSELYIERMVSEIEKHIFFNRVLQHNIFLNKRIWIIRCFQTHWQLSKFTIRDMPLKTKFTALVNARGLTDLIVLRKKNHQNNGCNTTQMAIKAHGTNMRPTWVLSAPGGSHVGPTNLAIRVGAITNLNFFGAVYISSFQRNGWWIKNHDM